MSSLARETDCFSFTVRDVALTEAIHDTIKVEFESNVYSRQCISIQETEDNIVISTFLIRDTQEYKKKKRELR